MDKDDDSHNRMPALRLARSPGRKVQFADEAVARLYTADPVENPWMPIDSSPAAIQASLAAQAGWRRGHLHTPTASGLQVASLHLCAQARLKTNPVLVGYPVCPANDWANNRGEPRARERAWESVPSESTKRAS